MTITRKSSSTAAERAFSLCATFSVPAEFTKLSASVRKKAQARNGNSASSLMLPFL